MPRLRRSKERKLNRELAAFEAKHGLSNPLTIHIVGMWKRWPEYMREVDPWSDVFLSQRDRALARQSLQSVSGCLQNYFAALSYPRRL